MSESETWSRIPPVDHGSGLPLSQDFRAPVETTECAKFMKWVVGDGVYMCVHVYMREGTGEWRDEDGVQAQTPQRHTRTFLMRRMMGNAP